MPNEMSPEFGYVMALIRQVVDRKNVRMEILRSNMEIGLSDNRLVCEGEPSGTPPVAQCNQGASLRSRGTCLVRLPGRRCGLVRTKVCNILAALPPSQWSWAWAIGPGCFGLANLTDNIAGQDDAKGRGHLLQ